MKLPFMTKTGRPDTDQPDLASRRKELATLSAERKRLTDTASDLEAQAAASLAQWNASKNDPLQSPQESEALRLKHITDLRTATAAQQAVVDHVADHGDLVERAKQLQADEDVVRRERLHTATRDDLAELARLCFGVEAAQQRILQRARQNPGAGLPDHSVTFPCGIFDIVPVTDHADVIRKMVWRDHVLLGIVEAFPDLLDATVAQPILDAIADRLQRGAPRWHAVPVGSAWNIYPAKRR